MAVDILSLGFKVDTKDLARGSRDLDNFGKSAKKASGETDTASKSMVGFGSAAARVAGVLGTAGLASSLLRITDEYTKLNAQLRISARTQADYSKSLQDVIRISNSAQSSLDGTATLYARLSNTLKDTNVTQQQFANITESVALGLRVSGATTAEAQSAMLQLSQAFAAGVLRGEEFNAVSEASFPLMKALADSMGIPIEQLRTMAMNGKITRDELVKAFGDPALIATFQNQAKELNTVGGAFQVLKNNITIAIGEFDKATGASAALAKGITFLAQNMDILLIALAPIGVALAALAAPAVLAGLGALAAVFAAPAGIIALLGVAAAAVVKFGNNSDSAYDKALKGAQKYNEEQRKTAGITKATVSEEVKQYNSLGNAKAEATKRVDELQKRIKLYEVQAANKGYVPELKKNLEDAQLALRNLSKDFDAAYLKFSQQGRVTGNKVPFNRAILPDFTGAPNFSSTVEVQNVDKINAKLEERAEREKKLYDDRIQAIKDADKAELDRYTARFNMAKEFNDMETKFYNLLEKTKADDDKKRFDEANKRVALIQKQANENFKQAQDAQNQIGREAEQIANQMNRSLTDALLRGFESGLSFAENFKRTLRNMFSTLVLQPVINFILQPITGAVSSAVAGALGTGTANASVMGGSGGLGNIADTLGSVKNLFTNSNAAIVSGIESVGASIANGMGGIRDSIGGFIGQNSAFISKALPFLDAGVKLLSGDVKGAAFSAAGTAIGLAVGGPLGAAVGTFVGNLVGGMFGSKKQPPRTVNELPDVAEVFNQQLSTLLKSFGRTGEVTSSATFTGRAGGSGYGDLRATVDGMAVNDSIRYKDAYSDATMQEFITRTLTTTLTGAIKSVEIDQAFKDLFDGITDRDEMGKTIQAVVQLNQNNEQLTNTLGITATQVALLANESDIAGDNLILLANTLTGISAELFTTGDALVAIKAGIDGAFTTLTNTQVPNNLKAFDEALKAIDKTTAEGRQDFLGLIALRETFAEFENAILGLEGNVRGALVGIVSEAERQAMLEEDLSELFSDLNREVPTTVQELIALGKSIDYTTAEGINLANVFPTLVSAFMTTRGAVGSLTDGLTGLSKIAESQQQIILQAAVEANRIAQQNLQEANRNVDIARDNLMNSFDAERTRLQGIIDNVGSLRENLATVIAAEKDRLQSIINNVDTLKNALLEAFDTKRNGLQSVVDAVGDFKQQLSDVIDIERNRLQGIIVNVDNLKNALQQAFDVERSRLEGIVRAVGDVRQELANIIEVERSRYQEIISNVDSFKDALRQAFDTKASGLQDTISKFKDFGKTIREFRKGLTQASIAVSNPLPFSRARFLETASLAKAGDESAMNELTSVASDFLESSENYSRDFNEYQSDFLEVNRILADVENSTFASASVAELQLDLLKKQVGALIEIDENVLSVEDAIANLLDAQSQANVAQLEIKRLNEIQAQYLNSSNDSLISVDATISKLVEAQNEANIAQTRIEQLNQLQAQYLGTSNDTLVSVDDAINNLIQAQAEANIAQAEIIRLNQIQEQYLGTSNESLMSVDEAVANLNKAQAEANAAQIEIERLNVLQTLFLGSSNETLKSVDDSIIELVLAQSLASEAQAEIERLNAIQTQYLGESNESLISVNTALENLLNAQTLASEAQFGLNNLNKIQVEMLGVINNSVLDVATAISRFNVAVQAQVNAQAAANTTQAEVNKLQPKAEPTLTPENIYTRFLGREADAEGLAFWQKQFGETVDMDELRTFQQSVIENLALGFEQTDEAKAFASLKFANGGAFTNGIVSRPTMFNTGIMGEAGSEAIMPLSNINGKLGVSTNNSEMVVQLKIISDKISRLESAQIATVLNTGKVAKIIERADNGDSINVTVTA